MIIPIPVGAIRRAAEQARRDEEARRGAAAAAGYKCRYCGEVDLPEPVRGGNLWLHVLGYMAWIVPGIVYGMWRNRHRRLKCRRCGGVAAEGQEAIAAFFEAIGERRRPAV